MGYLRSTFLAFLLLIPLFASALPSKPLSIEEHNNLVPARICLENVEGNKADGIIPAEKYQAAVDKCLTQAKAALGRDISFNELTQNVKTTPELTAMQKAAGFLDSVGWGKVFSVIGIAVFGSICLAVTFPLWSGLPKEFFEGVAYMIAIGLSVYGLTLETNNAIWGFLGTLLFIGSMVFTVNLHNLKGDGTAFFLVIMAYAGILAFLYQSSLIGFVAVTALMCAAGFMAHAFGLGFAIGFDDEKSVSIGTTVAFLTLGAYVAMRIFHIDQPYIQIFAPGAYWMGSFVGYLGLLIMASKWYARSRYGVSASYFAMNLIVMPVAGIGAIVIGGTYGIPELQKIGGTFLALWAIEKYVEWTFRGLVSVSFFGLIGSIGVFTLMNWITAHSDKLGPFLYFVS